MLYLSYFDKSFLYFVCVQISYILKSFISIISKKETMSVTWLLLPIYPHLTTPINTIPPSFHILYLTYLYIIPHAPIPQLHPPYTTTLYTTPWLLHSSNQPSNTPDPPHYTWSIIHIYLSLQRITFRLVMFRNVVLFQKL